MSKNGKKIMERRESEAASKEKESPSTITFKGIEIVYEPDMGLEEDQLALIRPFTEDEKWRLENGEAVIRRIGDKVYLDQKVRIKEGRPSLVLKFMDADPEDLVEVVGIDPGAPEGSFSVGQPVFKTDDGEVTLEEAEKIPSLWTPDDPEKAETSEEIRGGKIKSPWYDMQTPAPREFTQELDGDFETPVKSSLLDFKSTPMLNPGPFAGCFEQTSNLSKEEIISRMRNAIEKTKFISPLQENVCDCCGEEDLTKETTHGEEAAELPPVHEGGTEASSEPAGRGNPA